MEQTHWHKRNAVINICWSVFNRNVISILNAKMSLITITKDLCTGIIGETKDANEWITTLSKEDMERWLQLFEIAQVDEESSWILLCVAMALYTREMNQYDFEASAELCQTVMGRFTANVKLENDRREGRCTISKPLYLYKAEGIINYTN